MDPAYTGPSSGILNFCPRVVLWALVVGQQGAGWILVGSFVWALVSYMVYNGCIRIPDRECILT